MADGFGSPVAQNVDVNPQRQIGTLSALMGLRQQQLGIQQQQQELQTQTAQAYQATQSAQERQQLAAIDWKQFQNDDGSFDMDAVAKTARAVAPTTGSEFIGRFAQAAQGGAETKKAYYSLNQDYQNSVRSVFGAWASSGDDVATLGKQLDNLVDNAPKGSQDALRQIANHSLRTIGAPNLIDGSAKTTPQQKQQALLFSRAGLGPSEQTGPAGLATPATGTYMAPGNVLMGSAQSRTTGALQPAPGGVVAGLAPAQQLSYLAQAATATTAATGQAATDTQVFGKVMNAGADAQRGIELAQKIQEDVKMARTGQYSQDFANRLTVFQQHNPGATAIQMLQKDAANLKSLAEGTATTDDERKQIGSGYPSPETMGPDAITKAAKYWQGSFAMAAARRDNAVNHITQNGSTAGLTLSDSQFMKQAAPGKFAPPEAVKTMPTGGKLAKYAAAHFGGDVGKATAYLKEHGYQ